MRLATSKQALSSQAAPDRPVISREGSSWFGVGVGQGFRLAVRVVCGLGLGLGSGLGLGLGLGLGWGGGLTPMSSQPAAAVIPAASWTSSKGAHGTEVSSAS